MSRRSADSLRGFRSPPKVTLARAYFATEWMLRHSDVPFFPTQLCNVLRIPRRENACRLVRLMEQAGLVRRIPPTVTTRNLYLPTAYAEEWLDGFRRRRGVPVVSNDLSRPSDALGRARYRVRFVK